MKTAKKEKKVLIKYKNYRWLFAKNTIFYKNNINFCYYKILLANLKILLFLIINILKFPKLVFYIKKLN